MTKRLERSNDRVLGGLWCAVLYRCMDYHASEKSTDAIALDEHSL